MQGIPLGEPIASSAELGSPYLRHMAQEHHYLGLHGGTEVSRVGPGRG